MKFGVTENYGRRRGECRGSKESAQGYRIFCGPFFKKMMFVLPEV
jgi:hypothetical protein